MLAMCSVFRFELFTTAEYKEETRFPVVNSSELKEVGRSVKREGSAAALATAISELI